MDKRKVILTSLASAAVLGASVLVSQPSVVKADEGKAEEQAVAPAQPQAGTEGESGAQTEKGSENASPANPGATNPAKMTKEELMKALDELEEQAISDIKDKEAIEDKEDAAEAVKEYIGKMYISDTLESGELSLDNIIAELPEGAEDKAVVTGPEVQTNKKLSTEEKALLDQAEKDAKEQVSQATDALVQALESLENAVIEDIKKDASITDKEAAIKEAKEEIGKEDLLKAIADEDLEIGDVIVDWPADTSEHKTVAEPVSEFTDEDQAKLDEADKEAQVDAAKVRSDLIATLEKIEKSTIDDINKDATITDKEAAIKAAKEVIGKDGILKAIEEGDIEASDLLDDFLAEDSDQVTPAEATSQEDFSSQDQAKLAAADKEAAEEAKKEEEAKQAAEAKAHSELLTALEGIEKSTIDDINKDASITDKEAAIKAAKEVIGKDGILKAIEEGDIEASDLLDDFLAEDSDQVTPAEAKTQSQLSSQDQATLAAADKEAAEEAKKEEEAKQAAEAKAHSELLTALEGIEQSTIDDINKDATITDKEAAIKAAKEVIGKDAILKAIEEGDVEASDLLADFLAEDSDQVTPAEAKTQSQLSSQDQAKLTAADKEAAEEAAKVRSDLIATLEKIEKSTIDDINKDATITDKEAAIKAAKEVIGKDGILKAIEEGDIEASDLLDDFLAEDSDQVTPAEAMSQEDFSSQDQAKLAAADKEAAEENSNAKKLELSKLEEQVAKIKAQLSSLQVSGDKNSQVKDLQQALVDYEDAIKTLSSVMSAVLEIEDFKGGVNAVEAATAELPEYNKGANAVEAAVNELPAYAESGAPVVANVPAYGESGAPIVNNTPPYAESGAPAVANVPAYGESGTPIVNNTPPYAESGAPVVANVPAYGESGTPIVNNALPYGESGAPAVANVPAYGESGAPALANVPVYGESGAPAVATIPAYAEKIEPAVNEVPEYTGSVAPLATNPTLGTEQDRTYKAPAATDEQLLPNTGSKDASAVASLGFVGLLLGLLPFAKRKFNK
ncbi:SIALI-17 repeat-containing surface protein [Streptococcus oralis subsp. oralis]|uniref:LPXTG-motif cell wall anchor domain protein n=4 Tax=Streptococcus oralis TaxID=1303 RepID=A0A081R3Y8_STROR|nr:SIALI-17 repeat-containing surface protein [Streptococcus oralis]KEQ49911.1 LPXTG-motif cell wall anchor domain protein [Streptococcus oralis]OOR77871.1 cell wall anchor protein [Streptococcus oralis]QQB72778.1 LPXTG cell wall anchor domain-containing protein [Streptococcus oralis]VEF79866.1 cell wall surface anchor family protein [Streptococcus oralis ATCC 35037]